VSTPNIKSNYYACLATTVEDDDKTFITSNCTCTKTTLTVGIPNSTHRSSRTAEIQKATTQATTIFNTANIEIGIDLAIADAVATNHFLTAGAPVHNKQTTTNPLTINLPDGAQLRSTHTATLDIPWLPTTAR
jgi:hypothetical protein